MPTSPLSQPTDGHSDHRDTLKFGKKKLFKNQKETCPVSVHKRNNRGHYHSNVLIIYRKIKFQLIIPITLIINTQKTRPFKYTTLNTCKTIIKSTYKHTVNHFDTNIMCITLSRSLIKFLLKSSNGITRSHFRNFLLFYGIDLIGLLLSFSYHSYSTIARRRVHKLKVQYNQNLPSVET
jgi:hypothetical protein